MKHGKMGGNAWEELVQMRGRGGEVTVQQQISAAFSGGDITKDNLKKEKKKRILDCPSTVYLIESWNDMHGFLSTETILAMTTTTATAIL